MQEINKYTVFNIREYLNTENPELGERIVSCSFRVFM